jgi:hypothetical protein
MSQATIMSGRNEKGSTRPRRIRPLKRDFAADVSAGEGGVVLQIFPAIGDLAA